MGYECVGGGCSSGVAHQGVCKPLPTSANACWSTADCAMGASCSSARVCPCGADCFVADALGTCN
jgi:hypothetical protein